MPALIHPRSPSSIHLMSSSPLRITKISSVVEFQDIVKKMGDFLHRDAITDFYETFLDTNNLMHIRAIQTILLHAATLQDTKERHRQYAFFRHFLSADKKTTAELYLPLLKQLKETKDRLESQLDLHVLNDLWQIK